MVDPRVSVVEGDIRDELQKAVQAEGGNFQLAGWDWRYYAEKVRKAKFDVDEAAPEVTKRAPLAGKSSGD